VAVSPSPGVVAVASLLPGVVESSLAHPAIPMLPAIAAARRRPRLVVGTITTFGTLAKKHFPG
jgi:hypothetical protein